MTLFAITTHDAAGAADIRAAYRQGHLDHFRANEGDIAVAGPLFDQSGETVGSLLILKAKSADIATRWIKGDPFYGAGAWSSIVVHQFKAASGDWL